MAWYSLNCGDPALCGSKVQEILLIFERISSACELPPGAAVFARHESNGDLHCELILYFTPEAITVARAVEAIACNKPVSRGLAKLLPNY